MRRRRIGYERTRARLDRARGLLRPELIALVVLAAVVAAVSASSRLSSADVELTAGGGGALTLSNTKEGSAILALGGMRPGDTAVGTVTIGNTGTVPGDLSLATSNLADTPGVGGGALSGELDLVVTDITNAGSPVTVYTGKIAAFTPAALGTLAAGDSRTYDFRVLFPDAGPGAENAYQGSSMSVQFDWTATNNDPDADPPDTTITSAPAALVASSDADFSFTASEAGSTFECSLDGAPFGPCTSPATYVALADGSHTFEVRATDAAGNVDASPAQHAWSVDATPPSATLNDPGAFLRGTITLTSTTGDAGSGVASVSYQHSPAGAGSWTAIPVAWNTTSVTDGLYDLRVVVTDNAGNSTASAAVTGRRVDNTKPTLASSTPADGSTIASAGSLQLVAGEDVAGVVNAMLDGVPAPAPAVAGSTVTYTTAFGDGPHTLAGELEDLAGNRRPIRVHFTVWSLAAADYPYVEKNSFSSSASALRSASDTTTVTMPAGSWSGAPAGDWLVFRVDPSPAGAVGNGFQAASEILDVTAYWALAGTAVRNFDEALRIEVDNSAGNVVPATLVGGSWRAIPAVPGTSLPSGWDDGFVRNGSNIRILTRHLSYFTLLRDVKAPSVPGGFKGTVSGGSFSLGWSAASDNSGLVSAYRVYANGAVVKTLGGSARSAGMGVFRTGDARGFQVAAVDEAGNVGARSVTLKIVPTVKGLTLASAKSALTKRGFAAGAITYVHSSTVAAGKVISAGASGLRKKGTKISLTVSSGPAASTQPDNASPPPPTPGFTSPPPSPYPSPTSTPPPPPPTETNPAPKDDTSASEPGLDRIDPAQRASEEPSVLRRFLGYALVPFALVAALGTGVHLRRAHVRAPGAVVAGTEPIVLWDVRLLRLVTDTIRRLTRRG